MNLHLFSIPGRDDIRDILETSRPYLGGKENALVAYLPAGQLGNTYQEYTEKAFRGLAKVKTIDPEMMSLPEMQAVLRRASLLYIPGGNAYLLSHRLHICNLMDFLRKKVVAGLPLVAFSAGAALCGPNILTSNDINSIETTYFGGLNVTSFNINSHYPQTEFERLVRDDWLSEYRVFHENPVVLLADGAHVQVEGRITRLVKGEAWILRKRQEKQELAEGDRIEY